MRLLVLAIASCSSGTPQQDVSDAGVCVAPPIDPWNRPHPTSASPPDLAFIGQGAANLAKSTDLAAAAPHAITMAAHASNITALAATEDGKLAVTADALGAARLWLALDGTKEPIVVAANRPAALAILRAGAEIAFADLDAAGGLRSSALTATASRSAVTVSRRDRPDHPRWRDR
jgi:hypothetical protein